MKRLYIIGSGPGGLEHLSPAAHAALESCTDLAGHGLYLNLLGPLTEGKTRHKTPMGEELARAALALDLAASGRTTALISSGDAGIYGMAGIMHEVAADTPDVDIEVIPGVTAASAGAALLGAPLIADACLISLSDLLTPWDKIENRLDCAAAGDFVICLYNPARKKRADYLEKACDIILRHQSAHTPAGIVRNIGRDGQDVKILTLGELRTQHLDMFCTVFIGNSQTKILNGKLVTPRGYRL